MKKKVIGIAAGLILLAAAGGYAGVGHYYASHFFPKTAINGLNCAGLTAEQVKEEIQKHIVDYTLSITERGGKTETLSGTEIGLTYVDDHAVEKLLESQNTLAWPAFYWKEKENQVAADSVYDKEMVQEKLQTMEGFQEEQQEAVLLHLEEVYGLEAKDTENLSDALMATAKYMVEENLEEYLDGLLYMRWMPERRAWIWKKKMFTGNRTLRRMMKH